MQRGRKPKLKVNGKPQTASKAKAKPSAAASLSAQSPSNPGATVRKGGVNAAYRRLVRSLREYDLLRDADKQAAYVAAIHFDILTRAYREMESLTRDDENGVTRKHPLLQVIKDASENFRQYAVEFGMTPVSRARLQLTAKDVDPFEQFLEGADFMEDKTR